MIANGHRCRKPQLTKDTPNEWRRWKNTLQTSGELTCIFWSEEVRSFSVFNRLSVLLLTDNDDFTRLALSFDTAWNLQSYWTTTKLRKLTVVLNYYEAMQTYSRIGLLQSYGNLQSYWTTTKLRNLQSYWTITHINIPCHHLSQVVNVLFIFNFQIVQSGLTFRVKVCWQFGSILRECSIFCEKIHSKRVEKILLSKRVKKM